jgi:hypothetical protein
VAKQNDCDGVVDRLILSILLLSLSACGGSGTALTPSLPPSEECAVVYDGTFAAIQDVIFARHGCMAVACHGSAQSGGLDLRPDAAYGELIDVPASGVAMPRVYPGDNDRSYLWLKLAAKTVPGSVEIGGSPMPIGETTLSEDELELLRLWIKNGAPEAGTVMEAEDLVEGCERAAEPITIRPLAPPPAGEGVQVVMPAYELPAASEREVCIAQYYDVSDQIPPEFLNESGTHFRIATSELRQDPQSHHLVLAHNAGHPPYVGFGEFTCRDGERASEPCDPTDLASCGSGLCAGETVDATNLSLIADSVQCLTFGPPGTFNAPVFIAQQAQERKELGQGVYAEVPVRGLWVWNSHAFNLTTRDHMMNARINYWFASQTRYRALSLASVSKQYDQHVPPYGTETLCVDHTFPQGTRLFNLLSHTHKRGKRFWVEAPDGTLIYENFVYNDPVNQYYDPPLAFDSPDATDRTIHYCAHYENGIGADGAPDPTTVKRRSGTPPNALNVCEPVACTAGRVGEACGGPDDHAACDSSPGAGDGECDACVATGGNSTEDEMFILLGAYYVQP